jgi:hypothetical protein
MLIYLLMQLHYSLIIYVKQIFKLIIEADVPFFLGGTSEEA